MAPVCLSSADHLSLVVTVPGDADIVSGARGEAVVAVSPWTVDDSDRAVGPWKHKQNYRVIVSTDTKTFANILH